jgi:hypothetical protein
VTTLALIAGAVVPDRALDHRLSRDIDALVVGGAAIGAIRVLESFSDTPIERTTRLWDREPSLTASPRFTVSPTSGGTELGLAGRF